MEYDLIIVGAGAAGMAAANRAVELGMRALILEKANTIGGSAAVSGGALWTAKDIDSLAQIDPDYDPRLAPIIVGGWAQAVNDVRSAGAARGEQDLPHSEWAHSQRFDVNELFLAWTTKVRQAGSTILTDVSDVELVRAGRLICGVQFRQEEDVRSVTSKAVVLASGGFQGDPALVQRYIGHGTDDVIVRSNPHSVGDGYRLAEKAGAAASNHLSGFYGHTLPYPLPAEMAYWAKMSLWFSKWAIAVDTSGQRFVSEQMGDDILAQALVKQPGQRGALIWDDTTHVTRVAADYPSGRYDHDEVIRVGAHTAKSDSLEGLAQQISAWGIDPVALTQELRASSDRLRNAPFRAVATQPSITTPFGGIRIDTTTRVLNHDNQPVPGLYAAGADAGGVHSRRYIGGLVVALVLGRIAAETVFESTGTS